MATARDWINDPLEGSLNFSIVFQIHCKISQKKKVMKINIFLSSLAHWNVCGLNLSILIPVLQQNYQILILKAYLQNYYTYMVYSTIQILPCNVQSQATLLGTPVPLLIHAIIQSCSSSA